MSADTKQGSKRIDGDTRKELKIGKDTGRVKVFVRVRPFNKEECQRQETTNLAVSANNLQIQVPDGRTKKPFQFDHVFNSDITNQEVSSTLTKPLVSSALNGFNGTLMAYGQTGTGKTHTLMGSNGITNEAINQCFDRINQDKQHVYKVSVAYLQIYQEKLHDLLNANVKVELSIRESPKLGVYVENLSEFVVRTPAEVFSLMQVGRKRLVFAETKMNRMSSRSHSLLQMTIERKRCKEKGKDVVSSQKKSTRDDTVDVTALDNDVLVRGRIHICDLAGSERLKKTMATGERLSEAQNINSSLLELGNVIQALADQKSSHIPFRNSVLTRLLQESLGGNCKTSLIVCVSPSERDLSETKCTLGFGSRAIKITNTAYVNMEVDFKTLSETLVRRMQEKEDELIQMKRTYEERLTENQRAHDTKLKSVEEEQEKALEKQDEAYQQRIDELEQALTEAEDDLEESEKRCAILKRQLIDISACMKEEQHQTKILLLIEALSMKLMASAETQCRAASSYQLTPDERGKLTRSVIQHVDSLMDYIKLTVAKEDISKTDDLKLLMANQNTTTLASSSSDGDQPIEFEAENIRAKLLATKGLLDATMFDILKDHNVQPPTGAYDTGSSIVDKYKTSIGSLFKILVDKAMLSCVVILEKLDAEQRVSDVTTTVNVFHKTARVDPLDDDADGQDMIAVYEERMTEDDVDGQATEHPPPGKRHARRDLRPAEVQPVAVTQRKVRDRPSTWEEMCEEFECTLSRIDNLLTESAGALDNLPQNNRKLYNDILDRTRLEGDRLFVNSSEDEKTVKVAPVEPKAARRRISTRRTVRSFGMQTMPLPDNEAVVNRDVQTQTSHDEKPRQPSVLDTSQSHQLFTLRHLDGELTDLITINEGLREENARLKTGIKYLFLEDRQRQCNDNPSDIGDHDDVVSADHDATTATFDDSSHDMPREQCYDVLMQTSARDSGFCDRKSVISVSAETTEDLLIFDNTSTIDMSATVFDGEGGGSETSGKTPSPQQHHDTPCFSSTSRSDGVECARADDQVKAMQWQVKKAEDEASCYFNLLSDILQDSDLFGEYLALDSDILKLRDVIKNRRSHNSFTTRQQSKPKQTARRRQSADVTRLLAGRGESCSSDPDSPIERRRRRSSSSSQSKTRMEFLRCSDGGVKKNQLIGNDLDNGGIGTESIVNGHSSQAKYPGSESAKVVEVADRISSHDPRSLPVTRSTSSNDVIIHRSWSLKDLFTKKRPASSGSNRPNTVIQ